jgi:hypothetical protein
MSNLTLSTTGEAAILDRLLELKDAPLTVQAAEAVLGLQFAPQDRQRMHELAMKGQEGSLTYEERADLEKYRRIGLFLSLFKSRARKLLKSGARKPPSNGRGK